MMKTEIPIKAYCRPKLYFNMSIILKGGRNHATAKTVLMNFDRNKLAKPIKPAISIK